MQRACAAERDERELPRIVPALDRDDSQGTQHFRVHDLDHVGRVEVTEGPLGGVAVELDARRDLLREPAEEEIRIGHRRHSVPPRP